MATEQTAETTRAEAGAVANTVKEETDNVAQQAQQQATTAFHQVQDDVRQGTANGKARSSPRACTRHEPAAADHGRCRRGPGLASSLVQKGAGATERLASRLDEGGIDAVMADVRSFARRQPGAFLLGAAAVGFVAGRLMRNLNGDNASATPSGNGSGTRRASAAVETNSGTWVSPTSVTEASRDDTRRTQPEPAEGAR